MKKVLLIDLGASFGGVEKYLLNLAHLLQGEIDLYALCVLPEFARQLREIGVKTTLLPAFAGPLKPLRFALAFLLVPFLLLRHRIQTIQVNGLLEATLMLPARLLGRRAVYTRHGPFELESYRWYRNPLRYLPRAAARIGVHLASEVICVSETVGDAVRKIRPPLPVTVIPNWLSPLPPIRPARPTPGGVLTLLCASRLEQYKGIQLVIEAMRGIDTLRLIVVGDGPHRPELERLATAGNIDFVGFQPDLNPYYGTADIFVMPSLGPEGMPMSSLEAMGRGLPCIFSDLPVHREITQNGQAAILFRSGDAESLRNALRKTAADPEERTRVSAAAHRIVRERYTETSVRLAYLKVFTAE